MRVETIKFGLPLVQSAADYLAFKKAQKEERTGIKPEFLTSAHLSLALTTWRKEAGVPQQKVIDSGALGIWSLYRYWITLDDDTIDNPNNEHPLTLSDLNHSPWQGDSTIADMTSKFVSGVNGLRINSEKKRQILKMLGEFRKEQYALYRKIYDLSCTTTMELEELEPVKFASSSLAMKSMVEVMNIICDVDSKRAAEVAEGFSHYGTVGQWIDDIGDFQKDNGDSTNLVVAAMRKYPDEYEFCQKNGFTRKNFQRAVKTTQFVKNRCEELMTAIPNNCPVFKNALYFFQDLLPLYARFETESCVQQ